MTEQRGYRVKEIFYTLQGEGVNVGRPAVFLRFSGCNLWSGKEEDRSRAACKFCDTDFFGTDGPNGGFVGSASELAQRACRLFPGSLRGHNTKFVVCTGGEPLLQLDQELVDELRDQGFEVAVETNGTVPLSAQVDWVCVSPKVNTKMVLRSGNELKLVFPQDGVEPQDYLELDFQYFFLQPMDGPDVTKNTELVVKYCMDHPEWRLSVQTHKLLGIP